ncbi:helix-turn-helix domain-containing protein [Flavobacterium sp.]|uniref:helix-turn-helix domain-containing protein n=1 Tax=Flavobacterium sp. TaxID=239 RepID=UPI0034308B38
MAMLLEIKQANYNKIKNGKVEITLSILFKIINILELDYEELFRLFNLKSKTISNL